MNWDRVQGNWKEFSGKAKMAFGKLTDDDITEAAGNRERLEGLIQKRYGYAKEMAKSEVDKWVDKLH